MKPEKTLAFSSLSLKRVGHSWKMISRHEIGQRLVESNPDGEAA